MQQNRLTTAEQARAFALAGNATITLVSKTTGTRFTFKIQAPFPKDGPENAARDLASEFRFVKVLTGADNTSDFSYLGYIRRGVFFHGGSKARVSAFAPSAKAFAWAWQRVIQETLPDTLEIWHEGRCGRCGRLLTVPESIASGFGPECMQRVGFVAEAV